ncbi:sugar diacid recognition domain-containing protein [Lentibacillus halophilus]|uniref:Sugar diacid recognition domain-containing protein n=1 Tax=Lentibacillus halophilus TaxID=295065 RepID=A0ABP3IV66_9BACI
MQFAQKVVKAVSEILPFPISLSDKNGYIIGSTDSNRIGKLHEPSKDVITKDTFLLYDEDTIKGMSNVLPGVAAPLKLNNKTVGVLGIIGPPEEVKPYVELVKNHVEMVWQDTFYKQLEDLETKTLETFAQYILLNESISHVKAEQYCRMLNIPFYAMRFCIVIDIENSLISNIQRKIPIDQLKDRLLDCSKKAFESDNDVVCTFLNTEKLILLKTVASETDYLEALDHFMGQSNSLLEAFAAYHVTNASIAAGSLSWSLATLNESYHEAETLLTIGKRRDASKKIYSYHSWELIKTLLPEQLSASFSEKVQFRLRRFLNDDNFAELSKSFIAYCDNNLTISQAAKDLFIHRNTLIYRLQKINSLTSINTGSFDDCLTLYLILKNLKLEKEPHNNKG